MFYPTDRMVFKGSLLLFLFGLRFWKKLLFCFLQAYRLHLKRFNVSDPRVLRRDVSFPESSRVSIFFVLKPQTVNTTSFQRAKDKWRIFEFGFALLLREPGFFRRIWVHVGTYEVCSAFFRISGLSDVDTSPPSDLCHFCLSHDSWYGYGCCCFFSVLKRCCLIN